METKTAKNTLAGKVTTAPLKKEKTIFDVIQAGAKQFETALPKHMNTDRFVRIAISTVRQNPKLAECSQASLLGTLMTMAQLGLEPGVLGQAYLIPFNNKKLGTVECQFQISYKGMIELLRRTGQLKDIYAYSVYSNDEFEITYGLERDLVHKPAFNNPEGRGEITGFYSVAILADGTRAFEYMTKLEVENHEKKYRLGQYKNDIWNKNLEEMAMKTVTKKMLKWLPVSVEFIENMNKDEKSFIADEKIHEVKEVEILEAETIEDDAVEVIDEKPTSEDMKTLFTIADASEMDITKVAKEKFKVTNLDNLTMAQYRELKEIAING